MQRGRSGKRVGCSACLGPSIDWRSAARAARGPHSTHLVRHSRDAPLAWPLLRRAQQPDVEV